MKVKIDIDCTPQEARAFLGWPDLEPLQRSMMEELQKKMAASVAAMEPEAMLKAWLSSGLEGFEKLQAMWGKVGGARRKEPEV